MTGYRHRRQLAGISQAEAARRLGYRASRLCDIENGRRPGPRDEALVAMAQLYACSTDDLVRPTTPTRRTKTDGQRQIPEGGAR